MSYLMVVDDDEDFATAAATALRGDGHDVEIELRPGRMTIKVFLPAMAQAAADASIAVGEPLLETKLADRDAGRGLAALIPKGMRAYTIQATRVASNVASVLAPLMRPTYTAASSTSTVSYCLRRLLPLAAQAPTSLSALTAADVLT